MATVAMPAGLPLTATAAAEMLQDARHRTLALAADLSEEQLRVPLSPILNPPVWEMGHVGWFQENWLLRHFAGAPPLRRDGDNLWNSSAVAHDTRWNLPLPSRQETLTYLQAVLDHVLAALPAGELPPRHAYFCWLATMHEDMHGEAFTYTRQTLGYPPPPTAVQGQGSAGQSPSGAPSMGPALSPAESAITAPRGDAELPGGDFLLGALRDTPGFVFDNEQWAHRVRVAPFAIARAAVTQAEFAAFIAADGYRRQEFWTADGWAWRQAAGADHPVYWAPGGDGVGGWQRREFDRWLPLEAELPVIHVNAYEAEAYCRWAGRRLPTEAEWEMAAAAAPGEAAKRPWPWGAAAPKPDHARLDGAWLGCAPVGAHAAGDSACGCRQMTGNVWEWTATPFGPYPGFVPGPYQDYSQPWFTPEHRVLRGGCWATRRRLIRNTYRNFYPLHRRDVLAGFRTCAAAD